MRVRVIVITAALLLIAAALLFRGRSADREEVAVATRGAAGGEKARPGEGTAPRRDPGSGGASEPRPIGAAPVGRADAQAPRDEGTPGSAPGSGGRGEALVIEGASKLAKKSISSSSTHAGQNGAAGAATGAGGVVGEPLKGGNGQTGEPGSERGAEAEAQRGDAPGDANPAEMLGVFFASTADQQYTTTDPIDIPESDKFSRDAGSVNFWLEPGWESDNQDDADFIDLGDGGLRVVKNVNFLRFEFTDANGVASGVGVEISDWKIGDPRQVTATWDGSSINLYIDGKLVSQRPNPGLQRSEDKGPIVVGSVYPPDRPIAPGVLTDVQIFDRPLGPGEVSTIQRTKK